MAGECAFNKCHELGKVPQTAWGETAGVWVKDELHIQSVSCFSDQSSVRCMNVSCVCRLFETNLLFCFYVLMEIRICGLLQIAVTLRADKIHYLTVTVCFVWADLDARPWDFQAEECALRANIERFNSRRYDKSHSNPDFLPVDNCLQSVLGQRVDLPEDFQMNYDLWLEREVFSKPISWEELLQWDSTTVNILVVYSCFFCFLNSFSQVFRWSTTSALTDQQNSSLNRTVCYTFCIDWRWRMDFILSFQHGGVLSGVLLNAFGVWTFAFWEILHCYDFCVVFSQKKIILLYLGSLRLLLPRSQFFNEIADNDLSAKTPFADLNSAPSLHYRYFLCVPLTCYCRFATHQEALHDHTFTFKFK